MRFLPLAFLAVALQILLPATIMRVALSAADPLGHVAICGVDPGTGGPADRGHGPGHQLHCPLCQMAVTGGIALQPIASDLPPPRRGDVIAVADPAESAGPRGPPEYRHRARAPPRLS